ncbi:MAG: WecB/TagA/CpsF family glycosyltransferase [Rhodothermales bacterium]|nr:WecB/TagA/CpsF family glycosyltransferase [Rhodothermales bacterium]
MIRKGKYPVLGINIHAVDYEAAVETVIKSAGAGLPCSVSALAVHGVMTGRADEIHRRRLNALDLVVPDGQPVRWALKWLHGIGLPDRVYGPTLTLLLIEAAAQNRIPVYFYGSTPETLGKLTENLEKRYPHLQIAGTRPSAFRKLNSVEKDAVVEEIKASGAGIVFVGLGCPRQEVWAYEYRDALSLPLIAVGAAFDFHAGTLPQAPSWMQKRGLEWLFRLIQEPRRLWKRYLVLNPAYLWNVGLQALKIRILPITLPMGNEPEESYG